MHLTVCQLKADCIVFWQSSGTFKLRFTQEELHRFLEFALIRMKEKVGRSNALQIGFEADYGSAYGL